jgi:VIT1/CCC1 family predicted Fe2+/Mn2+ transporter
MSFSKRLEKARAAFSKKDLDASRLAHEPGAIHNAAREIHGSSGSRYIGNMVSGGLDGIMTTFAVVSGVAGAQLNPAIIIILGLANLFGGGFSMGLGAFLSHRSEREYYDQELKRETWEVEHFPEGERQELLEIYLRQGYSKSDAKKIVEVKTANKKLWLNAMMTEELGLLKDDSSPMGAALATFFPFLATGSLPLLVYLVALLFKLNLPGFTSFLISITLSGLALFLLGAAKFFITKRNPFLSGLEMLLVGGFAASVAYFIGVILKDIGA